MWIIFALSTPIFWSAVHVMDSHCVDVVFEKAWMGVVTSALATTVVVVVLPFAWPYLMGPHHIQIKFFLLALSVGFLIQISQLFYFKALAFSEAGIVAAYWNFTPALLPIVSFILIKDILTLNEYVGISLLVISSVAFCFIDGNLEYRWMTLLLMIIASAFQVSALLLEGVLFDKIPYLPGFFLISLGIILAGTTPLIFSKVRRLFIDNIKRIYSSVYILFGIEILNLCALATSQKAISLGNPSLVAAVETSVPAYTFVFSIILLRIAPKFGDPEALQKFGWKMLLVTIMILGVWLISR